jgi:membrane protein EpsK
VNALVHIWLTPYLIRNLGLKVYGIIPLVVSFIAYFNLFTMSISNAVTRFVSIHLSKEEIEQSNVYFNSALSALFVLCGILLIPVIALSVSFPKLFQVPQGFESDSSWLFFCVILSSLITAVMSPFLVSTFIKHRFDLSNSVRILGHFVRTAIIVLCFTYLSPFLRYVGLSYLVMSLFILTCSIILTKHLTPQLQLSCKMFNWVALREMGRMSIWIAVNQVGALLYLSIGLIIINLFLGPEQCGRYATVALWATLLAMLGGTISNVFAPIAFEYIAHEQIDILAFQMRRSVKFLGLIIALPVGLLCGLSIPLLTRWLGPSFADLGPLAWLITAPWLVNIAIMPMFSIYRGLDKVKVPAIVTLAGGIVNVILSILLVRYTSLGIYGVALALLLCLITKNLFFTPIYAAIITGQPKVIFLREIIPGLLMASLISLLALALSKKYELASIPCLLAIGAVMSAAYAPLCYYIVISKEDRVLLRSLIYRQR